MLEHHTSFPKIHGCLGSPKEVKGVKAIVKYKEWEIITN